MVFLTVQTPDFLMAIDPDRIEAIIANHNGGGKILLVSGSHVDMAEEMNVNEAIKKWTEFKEQRYGTSE